MGDEAIHQVALSATHNPYFDEFIFYKPPNNKLKCFTFYPHPGYVILSFKPSKIEGEKHSSHFSKIYFFSSLWKTTGTFLGLF